MSPRSGMAYLAAACCIGFVLTAGMARAQTEPAQAPREQPPAAEQPTSPEQPTPVEPSDGEIQTRQPAHVPGARTPDRVSELISRLDPQTLNRLIGADIKVEFVGGQVILQGPEEAVKALELMIKALDAEVEMPEVRVVTVSERDAKEIARTVQEALRQALGFENQREVEQVTLTALTSNILLVSALPRDMDFVLSVIEDVDSVPDPLGIITLMRFEVKNRRASDVAKELQKVFEQLQKAQGMPADKSKLQIIPNNANNTITVTARETEREKIEALIANIDVAPTPGWGEVKLTIYPLLHSKSADLAKVIEDLLQAQARQGQASEAMEEFIFRLRISKASPTGELTELPPIDLQKPTRIIPDDGTNSLIIATVEENVVPMGELIRLLDGVPTGEAIRARLFPLRFADAQTVSDALKSMFEEGKTLPEDPDGSAQDAVPITPEGKALVYNISVVADVRTNTIIIAGRDEQIQLAETVIGQLDQPARALKFPLRLVPLDYADATRVGQLLTELFTKRLEATEATNAGPAAVERERVFLSVDIRTNALIVSASEENFDEIVSIVGQLDSRPTKLFDQIRLVPCERVSATDVKTKIDELWARKAELRRTQELLEDLPVVVADERSNALVVAASLEDYEEIKRLVDALEAQPLIDDTQLFKLQYADANLLADMLDKLFEGIASTSETFKKPTLLPDMRSNAIVVAATRDAMERAADLIRRLDVEAGPQSAQIKAYPLNYGSAAKMAPRMQKLFDARAEGQDAARSTPIVILAEESSNTLVCSASRDDHEVIAELLGVLDKPSNIARQFEIFPLKLGKAARVAEKLEQLFATQVEGGSGRADAIAVQADERTNAIIVWASPSEMLNIGEVIARLDTATPAVEMMVKVIQLKQALAQDFATLLEETLVGEGAGGDDERAVIVSFLEKDAQGREIERKLLKQDIKIKPDPRTNSLMVFAPADSMSMLEAMIVDFDRIRPIRSELRLFPLINSDAQTMVEKLTNLFKPTEGGEGETARQFSFGGAFSDVDFASVGQELRFEADERTNTIIAAGAEIDLRMIEELIRYLDAQEAEDRMTGVYQAKFRPASDIAQAIKGFNEQEQDVLGEGDDMEARLRRQERQVSVEAVGDEEKGSSSLIYGTSRKSYSRTMEMIEQIDRPEPQVMISVLIAEVTLSNNVELGIEIAGQELDFSRGAVVGPNGVIQGSNFDWISGTDLGAAGVGLGGFNFTITGEDFSFLLHALQADSRLEVLSRPILMVRNGEEGKITIADEVPIVESSQQSDTGSVRSNITRQDVGIVLTATPHISPDGYVTIKLTQEISNISGDTLQLTEGVTSPIFSKREVDTNVTVRDGETVIIGGLIQSRDSQGENKVPILGDIPYLGVLFRSTNVSKSRTELMVVLTVDVLRTDADVRDMSVTERDRFMLPENILQSPFMQGLRILPEESSLGPVSPKAHPGLPAAPRPVEPPGSPAGRPRIYGPAISRPAATDTVSAPVYGPPVVRKEPVLAP